MSLKKGAKAVSKKVEKVVNPLFEKRPKQFGIGGALPPRKDLHRFVKWPQVVRIQRKKMILKQRLKVPPPIHQFSKTLDKNLATSLFRMHLKYRPEDKAQKKERLLKRAQANSEGKTPKVKKPIVVKYGLNHVTYLIEQVHSKSSKEKWDIKTRIQRLGLRTENYMEDLCANIKVGDRCQVEPQEKRGVVKFAGQAETLAAGRVDRP